MSPKQIEKSIHYNILEAVFGAASEAIIMTDAIQSKIIGYNKKFSSLFEIGENINDTEFITEHLKGQVLNLKDFEEIIAYTEKFPKQEFTQEISLNESNEYKIISCRTYPVFDNDQLSARIWFFKDITEDKKREKQLVESSKMAALGELAGGIAHEINNPMTVINGYAQKIARTINSDDFSLDKMEDLKKPIRLINKSIARVTKIVHGLKSISANERVNDFKVTNLTEIFDELRELSHEKVSYNGIKLDFDIEENSFVYCNPVQIYQVLINLVNNAVDSIIDSGAQDKWIKIKHTTENGSASISVTDSGPGVSQKAVEKIFNPFFTTKSADKGTGLGLSLSKEILESHQGDLTYSDNEGTSTFTCKLPLVG